MGDYRANIQFARRLPRDLPAYGLIVQTGADELLVAGWGFEVNFSATTPGPRNTAILGVELGRFEAGRWVREMHLNGDETGANYRARIPFTPAGSPIDPAKPRILRVKVYRHE